jgi:hypothetical protein
MKQRRKKVKAAAERAAFWEQIIREARAFPQGVQVYLRQKNISKNTYYNWFKRLRPAHPEWDDLPRNSSTRQSSADSKSEKPETEVVEKAMRRKFGAEYKAKILDEIDSAPEGQAASILRREGLYSSHISQWRREKAANALEAKRRGPAPNPLTSENRQLREENARLQKKLKQASDIIEVQKKIAEILGLAQDQTSESE